jgi:hypothetical protein
MGSDFGRQTSESGGVGRRIPSLVISDPFGARPWNYANECQTPRSRYETSISIDLSRKTDSREAKFTSVVITLKVVISHKN